MRLAHALCCASSTAVLIAGAGSAMAQTATGPDGEPLVSEVVVTGSRIVRDGYEAPTPVTVASAEQLSLAAPSNIPDALNQLPQFRGSSRPQAGGVSANGAVGANLLNLRNLGSQRNLILLDGRRIVASTTSGVTNIDTLPQELVSRVETVTGGASAAYGSDAVAGVVNFILDTNYKGLKGGVQGGVSSRQDSETFKANLTGGMAFGNDRGHIIASGEFFRSNGLGPYAPGRDWNARTAGIINNVPGTARPSRLILSDNVFVGVATFGGLIPSGLLANTAFGPGGTLETFVPGDKLSTFMVGGQGGIRNDSNLTAGLKRYTGYTRVGYDLTESLQVYAEASYARSQSEWDQYYNYTYTTNAGTIFSGNPFIPAALQAQMTARGIASFPLGRIHSESMIGANNDVEVWRLAAGLKGELANGWGYDGYYTHGESNSRIANTNVLNNQKYYAALDAVRDPATGSIVCRSTLQFGISPGCVPFNPFGVGAPSQAALDYIADDEFRDLTLTQDVVAVNLNGDLFKLWSDPVSFAVGAEYRKETADQFVDPQSTTRVDFTNIRGGPSGVNGQLGPFIVGNPQPIKGDFNVREAYLEVAAPIFKDAPFAHSLALNGAARITDYSTSGRVTTWKVGATWEPFADLMLRATRSRDIRGPNIAELFTGSSQSIGTLRDPATGTTVSFVGSTQGNPGLDPEEADTLTVGVVYQPSFVPGLSASVDYYDIEIDGAIASLSAQTTVDECFRGSAVACGNIEIVGGVRRVRLPQLNLNVLRTSGYDIEASYRHDFGFGRVTVRALANYQGEFVTQTPGAAPIDRAGEVGQSENPKWTATFSATWEQGPFTAFVQERYIDKGVYNTTFVEGVDINDNSIPAVWYTDATIRYRPTDWNWRDGSWELFASVNNLFDKNPPLAPSQSGTHLRWSNFNLYDVIGRYYTAGLKFKF